jgi:pimeloyl-ACP methyl ester carboxylesterase
MRCVLALALILSAVLADEPEPEAVSLKKVPADGESHHVACKGATYWIVIPAGWDEKKPGRVILWLHGSNMNGKSYTESLKAMEFGKSELLVAPNGHGKVRDWVYNFDAPSNSTKLALSVLDDVEKHFALSQVNLGGHSQGAFYTYRLALSHPDRFAGAVPFAAGLLKGLDPKSAAWRKGEPGPAFAIVHGEADPVVDPELSDWAYELMFAGEWPRLRYYHPAGLNHWFMPAPIRPALEWCFAVASENPDELLKSAQAFLEEGRGADAWFCLDRADNFKGDKEAVAALRAQVAAKAAELATVWTERLRKDRSGSWWIECYDWREQWGRVPASADALKELDKLRKSHVAQARKLSRKAYQLKEKGKAAEAHTLFDQIVKECYTAFEYVRPASRQLAAPTK